MSFVRFVSQYVLFFQHCCKWIFFFSLYWYFPIICCSYTDFLKVFFFYHEEMLNFVKGLFFASI